MVTEVYGGVNASSVIFHVPDIAGAAASVGQQLINGDCELPVLLSPITSHDRFLFDIGFVNRKGLL